MNFNYMAHGIWNRIKPLCVKCTEFGFLSPDSKILTHSPCCVIKLCYSPCRFSQRNKPYERIPRRYVKCQRDISGTFFELLSVHETFWYLCKLERKKRTFHFLQYSPTFDWGTGRNCRNPVRIANLRLENQTRDFPNTKENWFVMS